MGTETTPIRDAVRDLLRQFYIIFERGFDATITGNGELESSSFMARFWEINADLKVCPACDSRMEKGSDQIQSRCDHHFPKSRHGVLGVHPLNFVPLCPWCNEVFKKESGSSKRAWLSEMFLPYAAGREMLDQVAIVISRNRSSEYQLAFNDGGSRNTRRLRAVNYVVELQQRWQDRIRSDVAGPITRRRNSQKLLITQLGGERHRDQERAE